MSYLDNSQRNTQSKEIYYMCVVDLVAVVQLFTPKIKGLKF